MSPRRPRALLAVAATALAAVPALALAANTATAPPRIGGCPVFPAASAWNTPVTGRAVDPRSSAYLRAEAAGRFVHLDLGVRASEGYGIPYTVAPRTQRRLPLRFGVGGESYGDESDHGPVPIPPNAPIEGGTPSRPDPSDGDRHVLVVQRGTCVLWELYAAERVRRNGKVVAWRAASAARWNLRSTKGRHPGWTSADAAGLPILPGLLKYPEARTGTIAHALRITLPTARRAYVAPASHCGPSSSPGALPYGARLRLKASWPEARYHGAALAVVRALKRYGAIFADQGSALYVSGTTSSGWSSALDQLHGGAGRIPATAFEVLALPRAHAC